MIESDAPGSGPAVLNSAEVVREPGADLLNRAEADLGAAARLGLADQVPVFDRMHGALREALASSSGETGPAR